MKTKLIILTAVAAVLLYACSDRDEDVRKDAIESVKKAKTNEKFKLNNSGMQSRDGDPQTVNDTIIVKSGNATMADDPDTNLDPVDGGDPTTITPPKR